MNKQANKEKNNYDTNINLSVSINAVNSTVTTKLNPGKKNQGAQSHHHLAKNSVDHHQKSNNQYLNKYK